MSVENVFNHVSLRSEQETVFIPVISKEGLELAKAILEDEDKIEEFEKKILSDTDQVIEFMQGLLNLGEEGKEVVHRFFKQLGIAMYLGSRAPEFVMQVLENGSKAEQVHLLEGQHSGTECIKELCENGMAERLFAIVDYFSPEAIYDYSIAGSAVYLIRDTLIREKKIDLVHKLDQTRSQADLHRLLTVIVNPKCTEERREELLAELDVELEKVPQPA